MLRNEIPGIFTAPECWGIQPVPFGAPLREIPIFGRWYACAVRYSRLPVENRRVIVYMSPCLHLFSDVESIHPAYLHPSVCLQMPEGTSRLSSSLRLFTDAERYIPPIFIPSLVCGF